MYRQRHTLVRCLDALRNQTLSRSRFEVIVVDNEPSKTTPPLPVSLEFTLVPHAAPGSFAARNVGCAIATGQILAFTDADCLPQEDWLERAVERMRSADFRQVIVGEVGPLFRSARPSLVECYDGLTSLNQKRFVEVFRAGATANLFVHRDFFLATGGFDSRLSSGGDFEWCRRALIHGAILAYAPEVVVAHAARHQLSALYKRARRIAGGKFAMWRKSGWRRMNGSKLAYLRALLRSPSLATRSRKLGFLALAFSVQVFVALEFLRLLAGGRPERS